jgi:hypothetical protein
VSLLERLCSRDESPWKEIRGKPLDDRGLARRLKGFSVKSRDVNLSGTNRKGYRAEDFRDAWKRYLPPVGASATSATSATNLNSQNKKVALVAQVALAADSRQCCAQCHEDDGQATLHSIGGNEVWLHSQCYQFFQSSQEWLGKAGAAQ